jgi:hypothetical protein
MPKSQDVASAAAKDRQISDTVFTAPAEGLDGIPLQAVLGAINSS